jgi:hypothetical protein
MSHGLFKPCVALATSPDDTDMEVVSWVGALVLDPARIESMEDEAAGPSRLLHDAIMLGITICASLAGSAGPAEPLLVVFPRPAPSPTKANVPFDFFAGLETTGAPTGIALWDRKKSLSDLIASP